MIDEDALRGALLRVRELVDAACVVSGRPPGSAEIVIAGKYAAPTESQALVRAGARVIGENRLQDLIAKQEAIADSVMFDFIGHLQTRKVRDVLPRVRLIHSVDRLPLIEEIARRATGRTRVLLQVNVAREESKAGFDPVDLDRALDTAARSGVTVGGFMALPPVTRDPEASRPWFDRVRELRDRLAGSWSGEHDLRDLSLGTSQDFVVAVEAGATMVRIGRGIVEHTRMEQP